jgi:hypothetical protein
MSRLWANRTLSGEGPFATIPTSFVACPYQMILSRAGVTLFAGDWGKQICYHETYLPNDSMAKAWRPGDVAGIIGQCLNQIRLYLRHTGGCLKAYDILGLVVIILVEVASQACNENRNGKSTQRGSWAHVTLERELSRAAECRGMRLIDGGLLSYWKRDCDVETCQCIWGMVGRDECCRVSGLPVSAKGGLD